MLMMVREGENNGSIGPKLTKEQLHVYADFRAGDTLCSRTCCRSTANVFDVRRCLSKRKVLVSTTYTVRRSSGIGVERTPSK